MMSPISVIKTVGVEEELSIPTQTTGKQPISLYFHIPFCTKKCHYCHFYVVRENEEAKNLLLDAFLKELASLQKNLRDKQITTIYFGGGTPSLFGPHRIASVIDYITKHYEVDSSAEITLEINPENITTEIIQQYCHAGINRASIGIQTLDSALLQTLGRTHDPRMAIDAVHATTRGGISNISIDLMYDLPHQTLEHWSSTIQQAQELPIQHLSLYNLTIEPHTQFFKNREFLSSTIPNEDVSHAMLEMAIVAFEKMGLLQYEISAFARPGCESRHNAGYWTARPFWGLGPSAFSYWEGKRFQNVSHLNQYCSFVGQGKSPVAFEEELDFDARRRELFVIQLRLRRGVCVFDFVKQNGDLEEEMKRKLDDLIVEGCIAFESGSYVLTKKGMFLYETIASELI
jgi:oxygen-independent coproporphyrinogen III oxidase